MARHSTQTLTNSGLPTFSFPAKPKDVTWFDGQQKVEMLQKQTTIDQTTLKTKDFGNSLVAK